MKNAAVDKEPQRRLKIAVLNRVFANTGGGAERYSIALVEQLAQRHDIHVFAQEIDHQWAGVTYHRISYPFKKPRWLNQLWYAYATWKQTRHGFDIVHSHENVWHGNVQTMHVKTVKRSLLGDCKGLALALRYLKIALNPRLLTYLAFERARMAPRWGRAVVAASQTLHDELVQQYPHASGMLHVITPGVTLPRQSATKSEARQALGIRVNARTILFVANDYVRKGLPTLLQALREMPPDVHVMVVGNAGQVPVFSKQAESLGVLPRVHFFGPLPNMEMAYQAADVLAHPTLEDSFGMVVLEAMAYGVPVVVSQKSYCGIAALLSHEVNALILGNPKDASVLGKYLYSALHDDLMKNRLIDRAKGFAFCHQWMQSAEQQEFIYFSVRR
jgi:glycosyltransferase involved in cell wall biosynthesis